MFIKYELVLELLFTYITNATYRHAPHAKDFSIPVIHKLMIKHLMEDESGDFFIIGTMIHYQVGTFNEDQLFKFRFNERRVLVTV